MQNQFLDSKSKTISAIQDQIDEIADPVSFVQSLTYERLLSTVINNKGWAPKSTQAKLLRSNIENWCTHSGSTLESMAENTLSDSIFEATLATISTNIIDIKGKSNAAFKLQADIRTIKDIFDRAVSNASLPLNFNEAYREALARQGLTFHGLGLRMEAEFGYSKFIRSTLLKYQGSISPLHKEKASKIILDIEKALRLEPGILLNRAFRPNKIIVMGSVAPVKYRDQLRKQIKNKYRLKVLPQLVQSIWPLIVDWKTQSHLIIDGKIHINKAGSYWASQVTIKNVKSSLLYFFGFLNLKNNVNPEVLMTREQTAANGKGMAIEKLSIIHLFDTKLLNDYFNFLRARNVNNCFTIWNLHFLRTLISWVNAPSSFFNAHPIFSELFASAKIDNEEWSKFLHELHHELLAMSRQMKKSIDGPSRDPFEPLKVIFNDKNPYTLLLKVVEKMEADLPPRAQKTRRAVAYRNLVVFRILMEVPMRSKNVIQLEFGKSLFFNKQTKLWSVLIKKEDLKNKDSKHAQDIDRTFSLETSLLMSKYWNLERKNLRDPDISDVFILPCVRNKGRRKTNVEWPGIGSATLYVLLHDTFTRYFGIGVGSNAFRHLVAKPFSGNFLRIFYRHHAYSARSTWITCY